MNVFNSVCFSEGFFGNRIHIQIYLLLVKDFSGIILNPQIWSGVGVEMLF